MIQKKSDNCSVNGGIEKAHNKLSTNDPYQYNIIIVENQWVELSIEKVSPTVSVVLKSN